MECEVEVIDLWYNDFYINRVFEVSLEIYGKKDTFRLGSSKESWTVKLEESSESFYFSKMNSAVRFILREMGVLEKTDGVVPGIIEDIKRENRKLESEIQNMIWSSEFSGLVPAK